MSWQVDPKTGDYLMTNGSPIDDPSLIYPAYYRIKVSRTRWMYAPNDRFGSDLYTVKKRFTVNDMNPVNNLVSRALQPIIDDKRAKSVSVEIQAPFGRNDVEMAVTIVDSQGKPQTLNLPAVGGNF
jgi:phage gp46-like protein